MSATTDIAFSAWRSSAGTPKQGLPAAAYNDESIFARECETVLNAGWTFVGFVHTFEKPGDVQPIEVGGRPVLLVKGKSGEISAFHNVCRHRCLKLVDTPKNVGRVITCPYHAWAYGLDGALRSSPYFGGMDSNAPEGFEPSEHGLVPIRIAIWHDWIFVNMDGEATPFETYAAPLIERLDGIKFNVIEPIAVLDFGVIETNWKFLMENFIEPYHVQFVHSSTTNQPLKDHATFIDENCVGSIVDLPEEVGTAGSLAVSSRYLTLFPNFIIGRYVPDQLGVYLNVPLSAGRTAQKRAIYKTDGSVTSDDEVENLKSLWWSVHKEDHAMCERLQLGRASPVADAGGVLSPHWEDSVRAFQDLVADALTANKGETDVR